MTHPNEKALTREDLIEWLDHHIDAAQKSGLPVTAFINYPYHTALKAALTPPVAIEGLEEILNKERDEYYGSGPHGEAYTEITSEDYEVLIAAARAYATAPQSVSEQTVSYQKRVDEWMQYCFGPEIAADKVERNHRFLEEALELVQSCGCTQSEAHQLVDYVYNRPQGEVNQEAGGVLVTLAALLNANDIDMKEAGETELARVWTKSDQIREKQAAKPKNSPLPSHPPVVNQAQQSVSVYALKTLKFIDQMKSVERIKEDADAMEGSLGPDFTTLLSSMYTLIKKRARKALASAQAGEVGDG